MTLATRVWLLIVLALLVSPAVAEEPRAGTSQDRVARLIEQLGHEEYSYRQQAQAELAGQGVEALDAVEAATEHDDLEIATRARYLVQLLQSKWLTSLGPDEVAELLKDYSNLDAGNRLARIQQLAGLPDGLGTAALCRIVRCEHSDRLARQAAIKVLQQVPARELPPVSAVAAIRQNLGNSTRTPARWLFAWAGFGDDAESAAEKWGRLVEEERKLLPQSPVAPNAARTPADVRNLMQAETSSAIVTALSLIEIAQLDRLGREEASRKAIDGLFDLEPRKAASIYSLTTMLRKEKMWRAIESLGKRFESEIRDDPAGVLLSPVLLYYVADAQLQQGKQADAEQTAARAFAVNSGNGEEALQRRLQIGDHLYRQGLPHCAEKELKHVADQAGSKYQFATMALQLLGEILHDRGEDFQAAEALRRAVEITKNPPKIAKLIPLPLQSDSMDPSMTVARMHSYYAADALAKGDLAKHREHLDEALKVDPGNIDVLIACYRMPNADEQYREDTRARIKDCAKEMRSDIAAAPDDAMAYNNLAWLLANTEGDQDEALRLSRKSLALDPNNGGYYDTLARVHYARGEFDDAVKHQKKAIELLPHSQLLQRQLELFVRAQQAGESKKEKGKALSPREHD